MKNPEFKRFKSTEDVGFKGTEMPTPPVDQSSKVKRNKQRTARTDARTSVRMYAVEIPKLRRTIRHAFNIYEDQLDALRTLQRAEQDRTGKPVAPPLADYAKEALDSLIKEKVKTSSNIEIKHGG